MTPFPAIAEAERLARPTLATRLVWALCGALAWVVVALSAWLRPDARGHGTHEQLGLPPCSFQAHTGIPCPGCGLTTSFANMAHLHVIAAFRAHLMGPLLFALTLAVALVAPWAIRRAYPVTDVLERPATSVALGVTLVAGVLTFALRVLALR